MSTHVGEEHQVQVGSGRNFWLWSPASGWDLTHPTEPYSDAVPKRLQLECHISNITLDPVKTALLIIDMQNFSLSSALGETPYPAAIAAQEKILRSAIPAANIAGIQVIWLNWGLDEDQLEDLPPGIMRCFGWETNHELDDYGIFSPPQDHTQEEVMSHCGERRQGKVPGANLGQVTLPDGRRIDAGRALMKGSWNAEIHEPLLNAFKAGQSASRPHVLIHKQRSSGMYSSVCELTQFLDREGIRTLLFSGMNTDQCVMATLQDALARGFDTILLRDGCATDSPPYARQNAEWNCCTAWGFLSSCRALAKGVEEMESRSTS